MEESILTTIKKLLGPEEEYEYFDTDIKIHINTAINILYELGVETDNDSCINVEDSSTIWSDLTNDERLVGLCKTYIYIYVKLHFDPPSNSFIVTP